MATRADKPKEYFERLFNIPDDEIDYREIPRSTAADWEDAEVLLPLTEEEFSIVSQFIRGHRAQALRERQPAVPLHKSITPDYLICLEDGKKLKLLERHLRSTYNMSPDEYRAKWGLAQDYPMVAPKYAEQRSAFARKIGLGQRSGHRQPRAQSKRG
jgi:predicted transcriptional regulator